MEDGRIGRIGLAAVEPDADGEAAPESKRSTFANPSRLMVATTAIGTLVYVAGPVRYHHTVDVRTWMFVASCVFAFCMGAGNGTFGPRPTGPRRTVSAATVDRVIRRAAIIGMIGVAILAFDRIVLSGLDYSRGVTALRFERNAQTLSDAIAPGRSSMLANLGTLLAPFTIPAYLLYVFRPDDVRRRTRVIVHVAVLGPFVQAWLYGGRSSLALLLAYVGGAMAIRRVGGEKAFPGRLALRVFMIVAVCGVGFYVSYIFKQRDALAQRSSYDQILTQVEAGYDARTATLLRNLPSSGRVGKAVAGDLLYVSYYFTHELPTLDRNLNHTSTLGPYYGRYQLYLPSLLVGRLIPKASADARITHETIAAGTIGWFSTAWGAMFLDFGLVGGVVATFLCGLLVRGVYRRALRDDDLAGKLLLAFVIAGIAVAPIVSIFTVSSALPTLLALLIAGYFVSSRPRTALA